MILNEIEWPCYTNVWFRAGASDLYSVFMLKHLEPTTSVYMKEALTHCQLQKCSPGSSVSGGVRFRCFLETAHQRTVE